MRDESYATKSLYLSRLPSIPFTIRLHLNDGIGKAGRMWRPENSVTYRSRCLALIW